MIARQILTLLFILAISLSVAHAQLFQLGGSTGALDGSVSGTSGIASTSTVATDSLGSPTVVKASGTQVILPFLTDTVLSVDSNGVVSATTVSGVSLPIAAADGGTGLDASSAANGALFIGNGAGVSLAAPIGTENQIEIITGAGSLQFQLPQSIHSTASPTFQGATFSGLTASQFVKTDGSSALVSASSINLVSEVDGILSALYGGLGIDGSSAGNGQIPIGNGSGYSLAAITGTANQVNIANGAGSITLGLPQDINVAASPTFANATFTDLLASQFVRTDASKNLVSATSVQLGSQVDGRLPIARGGTNSSAALVNQFIMHSLAGAVVESTVSLDGSGNIGVIRSADFNSIPAPAHNEGKLFYDQSTMALSYYNDEADLTIRVGRDLHLEVRNVSGSTITKGQVVYVSGAQANTPTVELATASSVATSHAIGMADHDIENNSNGYIMVMGEIQGLNTSAFSNGDELYLSATVPGAFTNVAPTAPFIKVSLGHVTRDHGSLGEVVLHVENQADASYPVGAIPFGNADNYLSQDVAKLYWNDTAKALGVGSQPDASSVLSASSITQGFLPPRMTQAQRDAIAAPAGGLMVFNSDASEYSLYDGSSWVSVQSGDVDLASEVSGILQPANGGTGVDGSSATNGQMLIGDGSGYAQAFLSGTANQVSIANGAGSVTLSLPQDIHIAAAPTFANATFTDLTASEFVRTASDGKLESASSVQLGSQVDGILSAQYGGVGLDGSAAANGAIPIGNGSGYSLATVTGTANQVNVSNGAGSITLSTPQDIDVTAAPTFTNATFTDLTASKLVKTDSNGKLVSATSVDASDISGILSNSKGGTGLDTSAASNGQLLIGDGSGFSLANILGTENQVTVVDSAGGITFSGPQNIHATATPTFAGLTVTGLSGSQFVKTGPADQLVSATSVLMGSEVDGRLPIANGGTNSSAALNNNRIMISSGGAVVEHIDFTQDEVFFADANGLPEGDSAFIWDNTAKALGVGASPEASAILSATSVTKGFLPPRMSTAQRDAIGAPAEGLMIYNTTVKQPQYYNGTLWLSY